MTAVGERGARPGERRALISDHGAGADPRQAAVEPEHGAAGAVGVRRGAAVGAAQALEDLAAEWATMNHGGMPAATSAPIIEPAEVPTM